MLGPPWLTNPPEEPDPPPCWRCGYDSDKDDEDGLPVCDECDNEQGDDEL